MAKRTKRRTTPSATAKLTSRKAWLGLFGPTKAALAANCEQTAHQRLQCRQYRQERLQRRQERKKRRQERKRRRKELNQPPQRQEQPLSIHSQRGHECRQQFQQELQKYHQECQRILNNALHPQLLENGGVERCEITQEETQDIIPERPPEKTYKKTYKKTHIKGLGRDYPRVHERKMKKCQQSRYRYPINMNGLEMLLRGFELLQLRDYILISLDLEMSPTKQGPMVTEIGISVVNMVAQTVHSKPTIEAFHLVPTEAAVRFKNNRASKKRRSFAYGESMTMSMNECRLFWRNSIDSLMAQSPNVYLVGHGVQGDLICLYRNGFVYNQTLPVLDTYLMWTATCSLPASLGKILKHLCIPHGFLHNAGNDAYLTMKVLFAILSPDTRAEHGLSWSQAPKEQYNLGLEFLIE